MSEYKALSWGKKNNFFVNDYNLNRFCSWLWSRLEYNNRSALSTIDIKQRCLTNIYSQFICWIWNPKNKKKAIFIGTLSQRATIFNDTITFFSLSQNEIISKLVKVNLCLIFVPSYWLMRELDFYFHLNEFKISMEV